MESERLYFRQLLAGRDFATAHAIAHQMVNFIYLVGDRETKECMVVDPAWSVGDLLDIVEEDEMKLTGILATHYHPDHLGGDLLGMAMVEGARELVEKTDVKVHCHQMEAHLISRSTGVPESHLIPHEDGDEILIGQVSVRCIHTPGHSPGGMCYLVENRLLSGDTVFLDGCGRTDLPGGDGAEILRSIQKRLAHIPDDTLLFPGHRYSEGNFATLGQIRRSNDVFQMRHI